MLIEDNGSLKDVKSVFVHRYKKTEARKYLTIAYGELAIHGKQSLKQSFEIFSFP